MIPEMLIWHILLYLLVHLGDSGSWGPPCEFATMLYICLVYVACDLRMLYVLCWIPWKWDSASQLALNNISSNAFKHPDSVIDTVRWCALTKQGIVVLQWFGLQQGIWPVHYDIKFSQIWHTKLNESNIRLHWNCSSMMSKKLHQNPNPRENQDLTAFIQITGTINEHISLVIWVKWMLN